MKTKPSPEVSSFIEGAEWVIKILNKNVRGSNARGILSMNLFPIINLLEQAKKGKITETWL